MKKSNTNDVATHGNGSTNKTNQKQSRKGGKHEVNLRKNGFLNFQIGLIVAMLMVYIGLEASFRMQADIVYEPERVDDIQQEYVMDLSQVTIEKPQKEKQLEPVAKSQTFVEVPNETIMVNVEEFIAKPEESAPSIDLSAISYDNGGNDIPDEIPFVLIEDAPVYPGCEKVEKSERLACFSEKIQKHVRRNIKYPEIDMELGTEGKVFVLFKIDKDGSINGIQVKGPSRTMEKEAMRIIEKLPKMTPGKQRGTPVRVPFSIPIIFDLK